MKTYYLELMLSIYILAYKLISFKNCQILSPATFVNKSDKLLSLWNVWQTSATSTQSFKMLFSEWLELHGIHSGCFSLFSK
jgi:hypothetical protein